MKKLTNTLLISAFLLCSFVNFNAQASLGMTYQAVIRNASNNLVANSPVGVKISIHKSSPTGGIVYSETHNPTTNVNGLATFVIGTGTPVSGDYGTIDWGGNTYYLQTETDPTGGSSYSISNTSQLMSVPYALYAEKSGNSWQADGNLANTADFIGTRNATDLVFKRDNTEKMKITNTGIEMSQEIKPGGVAGTNGQVLQSNGNGTMSWKNAPYNNDTRFAVRLTDGSNNFTTSNATISSLLYNLNTTNVTIDVPSNTFTINKSGLYHFDIYYENTVFTSANPSIYPSYTSFLSFVSSIFGSSLYRIGFGNLASLRGDNSVWKAIGTSSIDIHIVAPAVVKFSQITNNFSSKIFGIDIMGYLISE